MTLGEHLVRLIPHVFRGLTIRADNETDVLLVTNGVLAFAITHKWLDDHTDEQAAEYAREGCKGILMLGQFKEIRDGAGGRASVPVGG